MPTLVLRNVPKEVHAELKSRAKEHHRSMTQEALATLEVFYSPPRRWRPEDLPVPVKLGKPLTTAEILRGIRAGRQ